jgi:ABC-2 type transport system permease protein
LPVSAVLSLVTIISIYREGGILKRLRATPLRPQTILTAHVIVKLLLTAATLVLMCWRASATIRPGRVHASLVSFTIALLISTWSILSIGFLIASIVPTARFAQPIGAVILYPMIAFSGLFVPVESLPLGLKRGAKVLPLTYAVSLLRDLERRRVVGAHGTTWRHWL